MTTYIYFLLLFIFLVQATMSQSSPNPKIHGTTSVNSKWQIVIPSEVRHQLNIQEWDQLIVFSNWDYGLGLIKADTLQEFLSTVRKQYPQAFEWLDQFS